MNSLLIEQQIKDVLAEARSFFLGDGGDITFVSYEQGIVSVRLHGACLACPVSSFHVRACVEELLKKCCSDVKAVTIVP